MWPYFASLRILGAAISGQYYFLCSWKWTISSSDSPAHPISSPAMVNPEHQPHVHASCYQLVRKSGILFALRFQFCQRAQSRFNHSTRLRRPLFPMLRGGISFYTFNLGYVIDVIGQTGTEPTGTICSFAAFFPHWGRPIGRATLITSFRNLLDEARVSSFYA